MPNFTYITGIPAGSDIPSQSQPDLQTNCNSINSLIGEDHFAFNDNDGGFHKKSTYVVQGADPGSSANQFVQYAKTTSGNSELFFERDSSGTIIQLSRGDPNAASQGYTFLPGGLLLQWGNVTAPPGGASFTFPTAFTNPPFAVTLGMRAAGAQSVACSIPTATAVTVFSQSGGQLVYVMAIGV